MDQNNNYFDLDSYQNRNAVSAGVPKKDRGSFVGGIAVGILVTLFVTAALALTLWFTGGLSFSSKTRNGEEEISSASVKGNGFVTDAMVKKINKLVDEIKDEYFLEEVTDEQLETGLYRGLFEALGDPYSEYYTAQEYIDLMQGSEGVYFGIGAVVSLDSEMNMPKIGTVFKESPAEKAGLRTDDLIYMVDGEQTYGKTLTEVVSHIRGEENTDVVLTIIRDGEQMDVTATRGKVETPTVDSKMLEDGMGYLQITEFDDVTTNQFLDAMNGLYQQGMKGLILDLRANPGGNLATVVQIAQNLLPEGTIVYTEDKEGHRQTYRCKGDKEIKIPLVVLIDGNSASASEILAGAIQDYKKGVLVGKTTFGKGIVQTVKAVVRDGSAIKLTISGYFTPNGRNIHKIGIEPDVECDFDGSLYYNVENPVDTQLEKAKEVLAELMK